MVDTAILDKATNNLPSPFDHESLYAERAQKRKQTPYIDPSGSVGGKR